MAIRINTAAQNAIVDTHGDAFNSGAMEIRTGTQPASANDAVTGTLLGTITVPATAFGAPASGAVAKAGTWSTTAVATGTAGWYRLRNSGDTIRQDGSVGTSGADAIIDNASIVSGGTITVNTFTITAPAS